MLKQSLASMCAAAGLLLALGSPVHADPVRVPFDIIVGSTHGDMVPIFGVAVHPGDEFRSLLTYDRDAMGTGGKPRVRGLSPDRRIDCAGARVGAQLAAGDRPGL